MSIRKWPLIIAVCVQTSLLSAATRTWTGAADGLWSNAANWDSGVPVAGDDLLFPGTLAAGASRTAVNDLAAATAFHSIAIAGVQRNAATQYALSGNAIVLGAGGLRVSGSGNTEFGPSISFPIALGATQAWSSSYCLVTLHAPLTLAGHALTLGVAGGYADGFRFEGGSTADGTMVVSDHTTASFASGTYPAPIESHGQLVAARGATLGPLTVSAWSLHLGKGVEFGHDPAGGARTASVNLTGANYVQLGSAAVTGEVHLGNASSLLYASGLSAPAAAGTTMKILDNDGSDAIDGRFQLLPEGGRVSILFEDTGAQFDNQDARISYTGGDGNDLVLTALPVADMTLTGSTNTPVKGQPQTFTAAVRSGGHAVTGTVEFRMNYTGCGLFPCTRELGSAPLDGAGHATLTTPMEFSGPVTIEATYGGDAETSAQYRYLQQNVAAAAAVPPAAVPTLDPKALAAMALLLGTAAMFAMRHP